MISEKTTRIRCATKKCAGFLEAAVAAIPKTSDGNWQFQCPICSYWNLASRDGMVKATSKEQFDVERLPSSLRHPTVVTREPPGGV